MSRRKLLVVDHDGHIQKLLAVILARAGFEVELASDGRDGWSKMTRDDYAAIILDLMLPDLNGFQIVQRLATEAPTLLPKIIIATAADDNTVAKLDTSRIHALVRKPFDVQDLILITAACAEKSSMS